MQGKPALRLSDDEIQRARTRMDVIAGDVALRPKGRELHGLCPFHNEKTASFYLVPAKGFFHCFGCGAHGDAIGFVMRYRNLDFPDAVHFINGTSPVQAKAASAESVRKPVADDRDENAEIDAILQGCTRIEERSPQWLYLQTRGLSTRQPGLFAHPALECWELGPVERHAPMRPGNIRTLPAIVAPFTDSRDRITALLRIYLDPAQSVEIDPKKAGIQDNRARLKIRKKGLGVMRDGAVRLTPLEDLVGDTLGFAEGVETAGAVHRLFRYPTWACGGTARFGFPRHYRRRHTPQGERPKIWIPPLHPGEGEDFIDVPARPPSIWIPDHVQRVVVYGDNGETGRAVAEHAAAHWSREGRDAMAVFPDDGCSDFNDQLFQRIGR